MAQTQNVYRGPVVGLDVSSGAVGLVQVQTSPDGPRITAYARTPLPNGAMESGAVVRQDIIADAVNKAFREARVQARRVPVVAALSPGQVFIRQINVPRMSDDELSSALQWEAERYLPFDPSDASISFHRSSKPAVGEEPSEGDMPVVLVAAKNPVVNGFLDALERSGVRPKVLEVTMFALPWICKYLPPEDGEELQELQRRLDYQGLAESGAAYLEITSDQTGLLVMSGDEFRLSRALPIGAEKLRGPTNAVTGAEVDESAFTMLSAEIRRNLDYYSKVLKGLVSRVYLCGDGALLAGLPEALERETEAPVELIKPLRGLSVDRGRVDRDDMERNGPSLAVAVGLALRGMSQLG